MLPCFRLRPAVAAALIALPLTKPANAFLGFLKRSPTEAPSAAQKAVDERAAQTLLDEARAAQSAGNGSKASSMYSSLARKYPFSKAAAEASFARAILLKESGASLQKCFDAFQDFIDQHRSSPRFEEAIRHQFEIAELAKGGRKERSIILIKFKLGGDSVAEMFQKIIQNAPFGKLAPIAQFNIGEVFQDMGDRDGAVTAYQATVENYPDTKQADEAQFRIGSINSVAAKRSEDKSNLTAARDALTAYVEVNPKGQRSVEAKRGLQQINNVEALQSLSVAKFYLRNQKPRAAAIYLNEALRFGDGSISAEARQLLSTLATNKPDAIEESRKRQPGQDFIVDEARNLKTSDDFVGPTIPELKEISRAPAMRSGLDKFLPLPSADAALPAAVNPQPTAPGSLLPGTIKPAADPAGKPPVPPKPQPKGN